LMNMSDGLDEIQDSVSANDRILIGHLKRVIHEFVTTISTGGNSRSQFFQPLRHGGRLKEIAKKFLWLKSRSV
ncbi:MAG: hypothetical protein HN337_02755, partial [Deltaproteobacteria bacterium]|nr:hypothetical protein [Deltaproteobacteria bacterium]